MKLEEERKEIINLIRRFPSIIKREEEPLTATNLLKHNKYKSSQQ